MTTRRTPRAVLSLGLAVTVFASACGGDDPVAPPEETPGFRITFCDAQNYVTPAWVAQQDGDGRWQQLLPAPGTHTYRFSLQSSRAAVAIKAIQLDVYYATPAQLEEFLVGLTARCPVKRVAGTVTGTTTGDSVEIYLGDGNWYSATPAATQPYDLLDVWSGPLDLVAMARGSDVRYIIRPGLDAPSGSTIAPLDFSSSEAIVGAHANVTINNVLRESSYYYTSFGALGALSRVLPVPAAPTYEGVPAAKLPPGRTQVLHVATGFEQFRTLDHYFTEVIDRTVSLGPLLPEPVVTVRRSGAFVYPTMQLALQPEYSRWMRAGFTAAVAGSEAIDIIVTPEYLGAPPSTWTATVPDFSHVSGFQSTWALPIGVPITTDVWAGGGGAPWPSGFLGLFLPPRPADGDEYRMAHLARFDPP